MTEGQCSSAGGGRTLSGQQIRCGVQCAGSPHLWAGRYETAGEYAPQERGSTYRCSRSLQRGTPPNQANGQWPSPLTPTDLTYGQVVQMDDSRGRNPDDCTSGRAPMDSAGHCSVGVQRQTSIQLHSPTGAEQCLGAGQSMAYSCATGPKAVRGPNTCSSSPARCVHATIMWRAVEPTHGTCKIGRSQPQAHPQPLSLLGLRGRARPHGQPVTGMAIGGQYSHQKSVPPLIHGLRGLNGATTPSGRR
ncbi:hypothetical protein NDU88_010572 [Pleurodeles waltl]|uniref:Uncharacterized protein n=1 Tax=Pleurodeles waltl TaxID=8319 RepID=A0AAV7PV95_PLEWA|nr:hypothetical protein NDU88_010572 [Pleurodeles waltl]